MTFDNLREEQDTETLDVISATGDKRNHCVLLYIVSIVL